jgi:hypothetical protein
MKMPFISNLFVFAFIVILFIGCVPSAQPTAVPLEIDDQKISLEFQQNGINIPVSGNDNQWKVTLKPEPFTLMVYGKKEIVSIMALQSADFVLPLQQSPKPLVASSGTGNVFYENNLFLFDQPLEIYDVNSDTLQHLSFLLFSPKRAADATNTLKNQLGIEPLLLISGRTYLDTRPGHDLDYLIKTIDGNLIQSGESIVLLVFIEKQSGDPFFHVLKWLMFNLEFK